MTQDEIIEMARHSGANVYNGGPHFSWKELEAFAKLVAARTLMNIDPSSFMSYQEGVEAGRLAEREACARIADRHSTCTNDTPNVIAIAIRARGESHGQP